MSRQLVTGESDTHFIVPHLLMSGANANRNRTR